MDWFLYDIGLRHKRVNELNHKHNYTNVCNITFENNYLLHFPPFTKNKTQNYMS